MATKESYNAAFEKFFNELIEACENGSMEIHEEYVPDTYIYYEFYNEKGDIMDEEDFSLDQLDGVDELKFDNNDIVTSESITRLMKENKDDLIPKLFAEREDLNEAVRCSVAIGDKMSDGDWDNFCYDFNLRF